MSNLGLYVHFPFCLKKCKYCDFLSFENGNDDDFELYAKAVVSELSRWREKLEDYEIDTIFFGGGTPSLLSKESMDIVIDAIYRNFNISEHLEFTVESNPKTLNTEKLSYYIDAGINRLSIGVQSLNDRILNFLGRVHSVKDFYQNYNDAREAGFKNINLDIMFSIPHQSYEDWMLTLEEVLSLKPEHISFYSLKFEESTIFYEMLNSGKIVENDEDQDRKMYWEAVNRMKKDRYIHYEISNAAALGYQCKHNLKYWSMDEYLGIGAGAHSYLKGERFSNETNLNKYIENANNKVDTRVSIHTNSKEDNISEFVFTGLRKIDGISKKEFKELFGMSFENVFHEQIEELILGNWVEISQDKIRLTNQGMDVSNYIMSKLII